MCVFYVDIDFFKHRVLLHLFLNCNWMLSRTYAFHYCLENEHDKPLGVFFETTGYETKIESVHMECGIRVVLSIAVACLKSLENMSQISFFDNRLIFQMVHYRWYSPMSLG